MTESESGYIHFNSSTGLQLFKTAELKTETSALKTNKNKTKTWKIVLETKICLET